MPEAFANGLQLRQTLRPDMRSGVAVVKLVHQPLGDRPLQGRQGKSTKAFERWERQSPSCTFAGSDVVDTNANAAGAATAA